MSFSSAAPSGYLDFTNATPKAIKMIATSNIGVGTTVPAYALDVHGSANVGALHMTLPVTDIASNLVTYDKNTGQLFDSGGLFSNKLTVVSPHPPSAMSSDTTVITDHGTYVSAASSSATDVYAWQAFNETTSSYWETPPSYMGASNVYNGGSTQLASSTELGEWLTIEVPNEMTLRHIEVTPRTIASYPGSANLYATNDSVTWTEVKNWENVVPTNTSSQQIAVNATSAYKKYGMVTTKVSGNSSNLAIANLKLFGESLTFDNGHLSVTGLPMATVASNLVTYDKTTGKFFDSAGLFSNKLAVVSVQPPEALTGASTVVTGHGTYTIESPGVDAYKLFDKDDTTTWTGENVTVNLPYKTTLRYLKMMADTLSGTVTVEASHTDGLTWTTLVSGATIAETVLVNATQPYKKYKFSFGSSITLKTLDLFTESFSIDGGKVAMAQQPTTGGETVMNQHGPHGRLPKAVPLKKYPEIAFMEGKFDRNDTTNTYVQAGYTVTASSTSMPGTHDGWKVFDEGDATSSYWHAEGDPYNNPGDDYKNASPYTQSLGDYAGEWIKLELPHKIKVSRIALQGRHIDRSFGKWYILGSNDDSTWDIVHHKNTTNDNFDAARLYSYTMTGASKDNYYKYFALLGTHVVGDDSKASLGKWELYGYEEDPPFLGDTSVDTTFTSIMNTPQTTGAQVYVDGSLGDTFTNRVVGPTVSNTHTTYVSTEKYWELSGNVESNVTLEANTFLSGDAPHSLSMWFNSSNLEANASNSCIFSLGTEERLDHVGAAFSNNYQTVQKITAGSRSTTNSLFGGSCAINSDGTRMIIGAREEDNPQTDYGAVYIYTYSDGFWDGGVRIAAPTPVSGTAHQNFGFDVDINSAGTRVVVGAMKDDTGGTDAGAAWVYSYIGGTWTLDTVSGVSTGRIQASAGGSATAGDRFGRSVAMSGDGTRIIVGAIYEDTGATNAGTAYIYTYSGSSWGNEKIIRAHDNASGGDSHFGWKVAMNNDGTKVVVGAPYHDLNASDAAAADAGAAYVFTYNSGGDSWSEEQKFQASDIAAGDLFGYCVDINSDGTKIVVGSEESDTGGSAAGAAYVYTYSSGSWGSEQKIQASDKRFNTEFGTSASFNTDGTKLIVGARYEDEGSTNSGAAYIFAYDGSNWNEVVKLKHRDRATSDHFGNSVAMSGDGKRVVVGAENEDDPPGSASGAIHIFDRDTIHTVDTKLKLQSNTWHNLTYAYQGEGGSRVTYLDGRKVAEDQAFDSFQEYPNFSMTSPSQGGFKASSSSANAGVSNDGGRIAYKAFKLDTSAEDGLFQINESGPKYDSSTQLATSLATTFEGVKGEWIKLEVPERIKFGYMYVRGSGGTTESPEQVRVLASNDDVNWDVVKSTFTLPVPAGDSYCPIPTTKAYKYIVLQVIKVNGAVSFQIRRLAYYGHRENDLVRLPDPTNVLKYPHVAINALHSAGDNRYINRFDEVSTTSELSTNGGTYSLVKAFDNIDGTSSSYWSASKKNSISGNLGRYASGAHGAYNGETPTGKSFIPSGATTVQKGEWIKMKSHHKLKLNKIELLALGTDHKLVPSGVLIWGSDDDSNWTLLKTHIPSGTGGAVTYSSRLGVITVNSTVAYKYHAMVMTHMNNSDSNYTLMSISQMKFFGTEEGSVPIQIGGGNIDKVANFRVYDKFIGEDQALEIWDAQKDEFGRVKSSMTLHKGRLGIGTTEPQGRLAVLDEPELGLEGIQEFPPGPMSTDNTYIEGHGMFKSRASSFQGANNDLKDKLYPFRAFDKNDFTYHEPYYSNSPYPTDGAYTATTYETAGYYGEWLQLQLPYKIKLSKFSLRNRPRWGRRMPKEGVILAFDKEIGDWVCIHKHYDGLGIYGTAGEGNGRGDNETRTFIVNKNTDGYYDTFRFVTTRLQLGGTSFTPNIAGWRLFGTRESINRQSVLHDGRLTLTKSLDVPRIGPPVDRDDTPRRDRLVAEFNTYTNPMFNSTVLDTSGRNHHGIFRGLTGDDQNSWGHSGWDPIERALLFNSSSGVVVKGHKFGGVSGDILATISVWFRSQVNGLGGAGGSSPSSNQTLMLAGIQSGTSRTGLQNLALFLYNDEVVFSYGSGNNHYRNDSIRAGSWHHLCGVKTQKGALSSSNYTQMLELYLNGKKLTAVSDNGTGTLNLLDDQQLVIGAAYNGDTLNDTQFKGHISGVKFYPGTALTAPEVYTLYSMGRNGKICNPEPLRIERPLHSPGSVVQVEHVHVHEYWASSSWNESWVEPMWITIKPKFANSKILVQMMINYEAHHDGTFRVRRSIDYPATYYHLMPQDAWNQPANTDGLAPATYDDNESTTMHNVNISFVDWPKTCEAVTYRLMYKVSGDGSTGRQIFLNRTILDRSVDEHTISSMIVTEIAQ